MDEEKLNISVRKFLKHVGINSQRLIEREIRKQFEKNKLSGSQSFDISMELYIGDLNLKEKINGKIEV